jgi:hypothetical protein
VSGRGDRVARPPVPPEWDLRFANKKAAEQWNKLCDVAAGNCAEMHARLTTDPRRRVNPDRHHRLKGELGSKPHAGKALEQWQYEVTGAGRVWFLIDDAKHRVWLVEVTLGHPSKTDK